jgi:hypothetical protein
MICRRVIVASFSADLSPKPPNEIGLKDGDNLCLINDRGNVDSNVGLLLDRLTWEFNECRRGQVAFHALALAPLA